MRLQLHLDEVAPVQTIDETVDFLLKNCKPFLKEMGLKKGKPPRWLYSGRKHQASTYVRRVQQDRTPLDTPKLVHTAFDTLFQKKFRVKARSNSIFCTGNYGRASAYGHPFIIVPIGKYTYLYSTKVRDLYDYVRLSAQASATGVHLDRGSRPSDRDMDKLMDFFKETVESYTNKNLDKGIKSGTEVMVQCKEYFAISSDLENMLNRYFMDNGI